MRIGGFVKQSLVDWDGYIAAVVFVKGCNLRCFYCHNPSLVLPRLVKGSPENSEEYVLGFLRTHAAFIDGVVVTGGEPTLQRDLKDFLRKIKDMELIVKLDTNGTNPKILNEVIAEGLVDCIAIDIKNVLEYEAYRVISLKISRHEFENVRESVYMLKNSAVPHIFRTTVVDGIHSKEVIEIIRAEFPDVVFQKYRGDSPTIASELGDAGLED